MTPTTPQPVSFQWISFEINWKIIFNFTKSIFSNFAARKTEIPVDRTEYAEKATQSPVRSEDLEGNDALARPTTNNHFAGAVTTASWDTTISEKSSTSDTISTRRPPIIPTTITTTSNTSMTAKNTSKMTGATTGQVTTAVPVNIYANGELCIGSACRSDAPVLMSPSPD